MSNRTAYDRSELGDPTTKRAKQVDDDRPSDHLTAALDAQKPNDDVSKAVH
jgi:deoxyribodipyrimidine photo-lyase